MKYCRRCGQGIDENAIFCVRCGERQGEPEPFGGPFGSPFGGFDRPTQSYTSDAFKPSFIIAALSFVFNILGLVFFIVWQKTKPGRANSAAKGGLAGVSFSSPLIGAILYFVFRTRRPEFAKPCLIGAIVGFCLNLVITVVTFLLMLGGYVSPEAVEEFYSYGMLAISTLTIGL